MLKNQKISTSVKVLLEKPAKKNFTIPNKTETLAVAGNNNVVKMFKQELHLQLNDETLSNISI